MLENICLVSIQSVPSVIRYVSLVTVVLKRLESEKQANIAKYIQFPEHPYQSRRTEYKALLLKSVQFRSGRKVLYPFKLLQWYQIYSAETSDAPKLLF